MDNSMGHQLDKNLTELLAQGVKESVFPGAAAAVSWGSGAGRKRSIGVAGIKDNRFRDELIEKDTYFDLASLSKALSTTLIIYSLIEEKKLGLDDTLQTLFDREITRDKQLINIQQLLSHSSGLVSYKPYFNSIAADITKENKELLLKRILIDQLEYDSETDCRCSDPGFILLGHIWSC